MDLTPPARPRESTTPPSRPPGPVSCYRGSLPWPRMRCHIRFEPGAPPLATPPSRRGELGSAERPHRPAGPPRTPLSPTRARPTLPSGFRSTVSRRVGPCRRRYRAWPGPMRRAGNGPWPCVWPGSRAPLGCACVGGTRESSCDVGCSVGTFASTSTRSCSVESAGLDAGEVYGTRSSPNKGLLPGRKCVKSHRRTGPVEKSGAIVRGASQRTRRRGPRRRPLAFPHGFPQLGKGSVD